MGYSNPADYIFDNTAPTPGIAQVFTATSVHAGSTFDVSGPALNWTFQAAVGTSITPINFYVWYFVSDGT